MLTRITAGIAVLAILMVAGLAFSPSSVYGGCNGGRGTYIGSCPQPV